MPKVVKTTDVPTDPKRLYIYLYCDKLGCYKSTTKKQAAKSWLSLSESKRRRFLKTCRLKKELNDTQRVLHTEPFLKQLHNSTIEDINSKNVKDDDENTSCLVHTNIEQNELCSLEEETNKTCLDDNEVQNDTCLHEQQQNKTSLIDHNDKYLHEQNIMSLNDDDNNEQRNETCLHEQQNKTFLENNEHQNKTCLHEQQNDTICLHETQQNKTNLDNIEQQNDTCLYEQQQNKISLVNNNEVQNNICLENNNDKPKEQNFVVAVVDDESNNENNDTDLQKNTERHLDVNAICREINGSDIESLSNIEEQSNQGTNEDKTCGDNSNKGLFINNIKEPIPPPVRNCKELFEFLNKGKDLKFQDSDKHAYSVLLVNVRKEYIENYIKYLESLSDKQLQEHYLKECSKP